MATVPVHHHVNAIVDHYATAFDERYYLRRYPDSSSDERGALAHFLTAGIYEGHSPTPAYEESAHVSAKTLSPLLKTMLAPFIDRDFYQEEYADVRIAGVDPVEHFLNNGIFERRLPNPLAKRYALENGPQSTDVRSANNSSAAPTCTSAKHAEAFDPIFYRKNNADAGSNSAEALRHYLTRGIYDGRSPSLTYENASPPEKQALLASFVEPEFYLREYQDIREAACDPPD